MNLRVRFAETDQMGIAHHSAYVVWLEAARIEWLRDHGHSYKRLEAEGISFAVSNLQIDYLKSAFFDDLLTLTTHLTDLRSRRVAFSYQIARGGELVARATSSHTPLTPTGKVTRLPQQWQHDLAKYCVKALG